MFVCDLSAEIIFGATRGLKKSGWHSEEHSETRRDGETEDTHLKEMIDVNVLRQQKQ